MIVKRVGQKGFTLIELMISAFILTMIAGASIYTLVTAQYAAQESRQRLLAIHAARTTLETIKDTGLINLTAINTAGFVSPDLTNGAVTITYSPPAC